MGNPQLNIKDAETTAMVRELARLTGESQTEVVRKAVRSRLEREKRERQSPPGKPPIRPLTAAQRREFERTWKVIKKIQAKITQGEIDNMLTDEDLYDEQGLPK
jgi:hypothetical protein